MVMAPLAEPLPPTMLVRDAVVYLSDRDYDLSLVESDEIRVVYRDQLERLGPKKSERSVMAVSSPPRVDRLVEHSLELGVVAQRLAADPMPLLVVGRHGPSFIITRSDFTRAAGQMGVLSVLAALDASLDALLVPFDEEGWELLEQHERESLEQVADQAGRRGERLPPMRFLSVRQRLKMVRELGLSERLGRELGTQQEHELVTSVRNDIAHGRTIESGGKAIDALLVAERMLDATLST